MTGALCLKVALAAALGLLSGLTAVYMVHVKSTFDRLILLPGAIDSDLSLGKLVDWFV